MEVLVRPLLLRPRKASLHLYSYQQEGVNWLTTRSAAILADDMGLGKTVQAIAAAEELFRAGSIRQALVVCPNSLLATWENELTRWAPDLTRVRLTPASKDRDRVWQALENRVHVLLTNYEQLRSPVTSLLEREVELIIADEAHRARNMHAAVTRGLCRLSFSRIWALTGTPIERDPSDLTTLLSIIDPGRHAPSDVLLGPGAIRSQARPFLLRRRKVDVLDDLPRVIENRQVLDLTPTQRRSYKRSIERFASRRDGQRHFLELLNMLLEICDADPTTGSSVKIERAVEILHDIARANEKAIVFSYLLKPLDRLQVLLSNVAVDVFRIDGSMPPEERESAIKGFREASDSGVLLASSRVGSEGLTLTEANHVIFLNEWWNPSSNDQARDRVVRIGQKRTVVVYRFRCRDTVEELLERVLTNKREMVREIVDVLSLPKPSQDDLIAQMQLHISDIHKTVLDGRETN